ncbi:unnamed protein product [Urochloa humidicola]
MWMASHHLFLLPAWLLYVLDSFDWFLDLVRPVDKSVLLLAAPFNRNEWKPSVLSPDPLSNCSSSSCFR